MTTKRLVNRDLEKELNKLSDGDFTNALNKDSINAFAGGEVQFQMKLGTTKKQVSIHFYGCEIEEVAKYDPAKWNEFPKVAPPENVLMRIECNHATNIGINYYFCWVYVDGAWYWASNKNVVNRSVFTNIRFKPW